jgi:TPP-dependent trihydroxycyclohexane-1,2-dione (THcHDO) dehydratase
MAANATTKIQVNYGKDGSLINIYADNAKELEELLAAVQDTATLIESVGASLGRVNVAPSNSNAISYAKKALGGTTVVSDENGGEQMTDKYGCVWTYGRSDAPDCINGKMVHKTGVKKDGSPFWGWYDPAAGPKPVRMAPGYTKVDSIHPDSPSRYKK